MVCLLHHRWMPRAGVALLMGVLGMNCASAMPPDAEGSPLFAHSMENAFAAMDAHDVSLSINREADPVGTRRAEAVFIVDGSQYYSVSAGPTKGPIAQRTGSRPGTKTGPVPLSVTTEYSCTPMPTCNSPTCGGAQTCGATCGPPQPTMCMLTCSGGATCQPTATCYMSTCLGDPSPTCASATCSGATCGSSTTCQGQTTCSATCSATNCVTPLYDVKVPQPGQMAVSFNSSAQLRYALQYSTNLVPGTWLEAYSVTGNNSAITLAHTNGASRCYYRLLIQDL